MLPHGLGWEAVARSRAHHVSLAMNIVRFMVFLVLGLLLGMLFASLVTSLLGWANFRNRLLHRN
jgi:hypothetical protein